MKTENKKPFVPLYKELIPYAAAHCGLAGLGCLCVLAAKADFQNGWTLDISLRDLAAKCGVSVNTLRSSLLPALGAAGLLEMQIAERTQSRVVLSAFADIESGKSVSKFDTEQKNFYKKNKSVSKFDTESAGLAELFPQFVLQAGAKTSKTVSNTDTEMPKSVSKIDTVKSVSNFDTEHPLHTTPKEVILINNINNNIAPNDTEKSKNMPVSLAEVKAFFAEKNYTTDPEDFYYKNEARGWTWTDRAGKTHKIKNWKGCAWEFEKKTKARGLVNWNNPQKDEERLFAWYYQTLVPEAFANEAARESRWGREKGDFAFIASVGGNFERGREIIIRAAETLEKGGFAPSVRALANNAMAAAGLLNNKGK